MLAYIGLDNLIISDLLRTIFYHRLDIIFVQLNDLFGLVDVHIVCPLQISWIVVAMSWLIHILISIELPVYPNSSIVLEDIQVLFEFVPQIITSWLTLISSWSDASALISTLICTRISISMTTMIMHTILITVELLLLLKICLNAIDSALSIFSLNDVN